MLLNREKQLGPVKYPCLRCLNWAFAGKSSQGSFPQWDLWSVAIFDQKVRVQNTHVKFNCSVEVSENGRPQIQTLDIFISQWWWSIAEDTGWWLWVNTSILKMGHGYDLRKGGLRKNIWPLVDVPSGKQKVSYWKWPLIVDFPIINGDFQ